MQPSSVTSTLHPPSETGTHTFIFNHLDFYYLHLAVPLYGYTLSIQPFSRVLGERAPRTKSMSFGFLLLMLSPINRVHLCSFAVAVHLKNICDEKHNSTQTILESMTAKCHQTKHVVSQKQGFHVVLTSSGATLLLCVSRWPAPGHHSQIWQRRQQHRYIAQASSVTSQQLT